MIDHRFVLDMSDCVDEGEGCKAQMRPSEHGAWLIRSADKITLEDLAVELSYEAIRELGLFRELENYEWDSFAQELAVDVLNRLKERIGDRFVEIGNKRLENAA